MEMVVTVLFICGVLYCARKGLTVTLLLALMLLHRVLLAVLRIVWYGVEPTAAVSTLVSPWTLIVAAAFCAAVIMRMVTGRHI